MKYFSTVEEKFRISARLVTSSIYLIGAVEKGRRVKARFIRRTLHEPNLIIWFGACKDRRMNQLGSTDLYLGRPTVLFDCASRIERPKIDFDSYVELYMCRTKCIHYV